MLKKVSNDTFFVKAAAQLARQREPKFFCQKKLEKCSLMDLNHQPSD